MAIKIQLQDTTVEVGGSFQDALALVKRQPGRRYDAATKTWHVPQALADFRRHCSLPLDTPHAHITRYGNGYTRDEWNAWQEGKRDEAEVADQFAPKYEALADDFRAKLAAAQVSQAGINLIASATQDIYEMEECGKIKFSTPERRAEIVGICEWYYAAWMALHTAEQDAVNARWGEYDERF